MTKAYINGTGCISAQKTFDSVFGEGFALNENENVLPLITPAYKDFIAPAAIRRMAKGVKNGIVAAALAMKEAGITNPDAIITGTGLGCIEESDKFLSALIDNNEEFLTPTSFIQSTHNTVGAQIALGLQCNAYNFTYVQGAASFESALLDAKIQIAQGDAASILTGGIDEINDYTASIFKLAGFIKKDGQGPYTVLNHQSPGAVFSEGAAFFVIEDKIKATTYAEVIDVEIINELDVDEVAAKAAAFLKANNKTSADIDAVVVGVNGDVNYDIYYNILTANSFAGAQQVYYKHLSGEYNTASAFGLWVAASVIKNQYVPEILKVNAVTKQAYNTILLYNQYRGADHSFILISKCQNIS